MGARYDSGSQTFIVTLKKGKLEKIESEAKLSGYISYGNQRFGVSLELKTICTFASYTGTDDNNISI